MDAYHAVLEASETRVISVGPADPRWAAVLAESPHDAYQLPGYVAFAAESQIVGEPVAIIVERGDARLLLPLIVRPLPAGLGHDGLSDAVSPRGYAGPIMHTSDGRAEAFLSDAISAALAALRDLGVVSAFIRLHPLFELPLAPLADHGKLVDHGDSVSIDLSKTEDELWRQLRTNHRRDITAATRAGLVARIDEEWERFEAFVAAFEASMARLGALPWWRLGLDYFSGLRDALGDRLKLCVVEDGDRVAAGALLTEVDGIVEYHLSGTFDPYIPASPSKLIIHFATGWAKRRGNDILHLAGSLGRGDALIHFKLGFSPETHVVRSWRVVVDRDAYDDLIARAERAAGRADETDDFFPRYRVPG